MDTDSAYHDEACFSLTIPFDPEDLAPRSLCEYFKDSRDTKKVKNRELRIQLLKHRKCDMLTPSMRYLKLSIILTPM